MGPRHSSGHRRSVSAAVLDFVRTHRTAEADETDAGHQPGPSSVFWRRPDLREPVASPSPCPFPIGGLRRLAARLPQPRLGDAGGIPGRAHCGPHATDALDDIPGRACCGPHVAPSARELGFVLQHTLPLCSGHGDIKRGVIYTSFCRAPGVRCFHGYPGKGVDSQLHTSSSQDSPQHDPERVRRRREAGR